MDTNKAPTLSVLFPVWNAAKFLRESLDSLTAQTFKDWELVVMDGASTDGTLDILREYAAKYPNIRITSESDEGGFHAITKAEKLARGEFITTLCSSDGYLDNEWFEKCINVLRRDPEVSLVWGIPFEMTEEGKLLGPHFVYAHFLQEGSFSRGSVLTRVLKKIDPRKPGTIVKFFKKINPTSARALGQMVQRAAVPQKREWFNYWLKTGNMVADGNMVMGRKVFSECFPKYTPGTREIGDFGIFNSLFNEKGFLAYCIPTPANFGRTHAGQVGQKSLEYNEMKTRTYQERLADFRKKLEHDGGAMVFQDRVGKPLQ